MILEALLGSILGLGVIVCIMLGVISGRLYNIWLELIEIKKLTKANNDY